MFCQFVGDLFSCGRFLTNDGTLLDIKHLRLEYSYDRTAGVSPCLLGADIYKLSGPDCCRFYSTG